MEDTAVDLIHTILESGYQPLDGESPPLPEGKLFHLFLSHSSADRVKVDRLREVLEAAPHNLRCCYDERDFQLGDGIVQNIQLAIEKSACTCFFLSPNFVKSTWCTYEQELANVLSLEGKCKVIPIQLEQCTIPNSLKFINYVDASLGEDIVARKVVTAVKTDVKEYQPIGFPKIEAGLKRVNDLYCQNGCPVILPVNSEGLCSMTETVKEELKDMGFEEENFNQMEKCLAVVTQLTKAHLNSFFTLSGALQYMGFTFLLTVSLAMFMARLLEHASQDTAETVDAIVAMSIGIAIPVYYISLGFCVFYYPMTREKGEILYQMNWKIMCEMRSFLTLSIKWNKHPVSHIYDRIKESEDFKTEEDKERVLKRVVYSYSQKLADGTLEQSTDTRHKVQNHKICLCQAFDLIYFNRYESCLRALRQLMQRVRRWNIEGNRENGGRNRLVEMDLLVEVQ